MIKAICLHHCSVMEGWLIAMLLLVGGVEPKLGPHKPGEALSVHVPSTHVVASPLDMLPSCCRYGGTAARCKCAVVVITT